MESDTTLLLELDERNLAHFLSAFALSALAEREPGNAPESRRCWWPEPGRFAIQTEQPRDEFRSLLFARAHAFLTGMKWHPGLGGAAQGILASGSEIGVNPFIALAAEAGENTPLKGFSARVLPGKTLPDQIAELKSPDAHSDWLNQLSRGSGSWGFDCLVNMHASDAGTSSDAENTGSLDPFRPTIELLGLAAAAFFVPTHAWQATRNALHVSAWTRPIPLPMAALAATGLIHGLPARSYKFAYRGAAHGKGGAYHFFPAATIQPSTP